MNRTKLMTGLLASAVVIVTGLGVGTASAAPAPRIDTGGAALTLPLLGANLTLTVTTGPGGTIASADLSDPAALVATELDANKVKMTNTDGTFQLSVKSKNNEQRITAKADTLDKLAGANIWSGGIFSTVASTVNFTVGGTTAAPTVNVDTVTPGDGETFTINAPETSTRADGGQAKQSVTFTKDGQSRQLTIKVETHDGTAVEEDDDEPSGPSASLRITLSRPSGVAVPAADAAGDKTWKAALCDGTAAEIDYNVTEAGVLTVTSVTPEAEVRDRSSGEDDENGTGFEVRWPTGERVRITATLSNGNITIDVKERIRCRNAADPTTNVSTSTTVEDDEGDDHEDDSDHQGGHDDSNDDGGHHGGDDHGGEDD